MRYMTGRPGAVSDPVIERSRDEIIYAHGVAMNRVFGPKGKAKAYIIRSHAEDAHGASAQSLAPVNEMVTTLEAEIWSKRMVIHTGRTTSPDPKARRTKLPAKANSRSILDNWDIGWRRGAGLRRLAQAGDGSCAALRLHGVRGRQGVVEDPRWSISSES